MRLYIDMETYSDIPIKDGVHRYSEHVEVMVFAYAVDDGPVSVWDRTVDDTMPLDLEMAIDEADEVWAHNVPFDKTVLEAAGIVIPLEKWRCSMCLAYMHSMPGGLDALCTALDVAQDKRKLKTGKDLVRLFCMPPAATLKRGRATRLTHPAEWQQFLEYAAVDIVAMRACIEKLPKWNLNDSELAMWRLDRIINERGVAVDLEFCRAAVEASDAEKARLADRTQEMTEGEVQAATQRDALLAHLLKQYGISLPDMQAGTLERRVEDETLPEPVRELLAIRLQASSTSVSKYKAFLRATSSDGRLRGTLQFGGAGRTNRWAGRLVQLHNMSRVPKYLKNQYDFAIETIKNGSVDLIYDNVMDVIGSTVRGALVAAPGKKFCRADLSNIEGRVLAWLAGEEWKIKAFAEGVDLYVEGYSRAFGVPVAEVLADEKAGGTMRLLGKVMELACIAEDQLVLTNLGLVPIQHVTTEMLVWDGVAWVQHQGVVCRGIKEVVTHDGLTATADHIVWAEDFPWPVPFGLAAACGSRLVESGADRRPIRARCGDVSDQVVHEGVERSVRARDVYGVRLREVDCSNEFVVGKERRMLRMRSAETRPTLAVQPADGSERPLYQPEQPRVGAVWGAGDQVRIRIGQRRVRVRDGGTRPPRQITGDRSQGQQCRIRSRESTLADRTPEQTKHQNVYSSGVEPERVAVCEEPCSTPIESRHDESGDHCRRLEGRCGEAQELAHHKSKARVYDIVNAGPRHRFTVSGKLVHNCGFGGAVGAFGNMARIYGVELSDERALGIVRAWRSANPRIVSLWYELEDTVIEAIRSPGVTLDCRGIKVRRAGQWLRIRLPSGRVLCYPSPQYQPKKIRVDGGGEIENPHGGITFMGLNQYTRKWERLRTYGGRLVENLVQATARDVFAEGLKRVEAAGYPVVLHVHDEAICEVPDTDEYTGERVAELLATNPAWAQGLPLAAEGSECRRYRK